MNTRLKHFGVYAEELENKMQIYLLLKIQTVSSTAVSTVSSRLIAD